jgi:hypothetical protein
MVRLPMRLKKRLDNLDSLPTKPTKDERQRCRRSSFVFHLSSFVTEPPALDIDLAIAG